MKEILKLANSEFDSPKESLNFKEKTTLSKDLSRKLEVFDQKLHCEELMAIKLSGTEIF